MVLGCFVPGFRPRGLGLSPGQGQAAGRSRLSCGGIRPGCVTIRSGAGDASSHGGGRLAAALLRAGRREEAVRQFSRVVQEAPWDVTSLLRLHDAVRGLDQGSALPLALPGQLAVLLYSWNKADDLDATLASLFASQLPKGTSITILNNGATDHTASVLEAWSGRDTGLEMHTVSLPVNVGAPAARNWLMSLEQAQRADYLCYLDDDLTLPRDWVGRLAQARESYPEAGVWGCKVLDDASPWLLQLADLHLLPPRDNERFNINIHEGQCDFGQMDHLRPCSSVTGCCHLFARERLLATGPFDLIFSPSQCDDLHRDLRMVLGGEYAVCQGHLAIRHKKRTGRAALKKNRDSFTARWNSAKLRDCFSPEQVAGMIASMRVVLENDLASKLDRLRGAGVLR